jgi:hypothetical protein
MATGRKRAPQASTDALIIVEWNHTLLRIVRTAGSGVRGGSATTREQP